ncbi:IS630 family transposase [Streptomyces sp. MK5]|uniref:IS630 family transposase n=1 Tax=Streptomyces sp. MK5 TaxID=3064253 RepID=UPI002740D865|nr:IS630 family transposase [Streptomyces sp. MK5]
MLLSFDVPVPMLVHRDRHIEGLAWPVAAYAHACGPAARVCLGRTGCPPSMPACLAVPVALTATERHRLKKMAYGHKTPYLARQRATIVLLAARGRSNARIAAETCLHVDTVRTWRGRFAAGRLPALADRKRSGRPPRFTPVQVVEAKALACQLPGESCTPLSRWSCPELAAELTARGITDTVSASTVSRWLHQDALKPWQYQSWIFIRDPDFRARAERVLDLYASTWQGQKLGEDEYVISADEKTSIQARCRCHPTLAPGQGRAMRVNHTYDRGGALAYLAAYDVHHAKVFGRTEPKTGIGPFMSLVAQVMKQEPYASAKRVFWIVGNGSSHRGRKAADRLTAAFPNAVMVHTPVHASWLNQVEIYFSVVHRKVVSPNDFTDLAQVGKRLRAFEDRYNTAQPFQWKFTTSDLDDLLARLDRHTADHQEESSASRAA